jgi:hypothetical protein
LTDFDNVVKLLLQVGGEDAESVHDIIVHAAQILTENNKQMTGTQTVVWKSH